jgi:predicted permease
LGVLNPGAGLKIPLDATVLLFGGLCAGLTMVLFGTVPAWLAARTDVSSALKQTSRGGTAGRSQQRLRHALIIGEVALALVLLAGAGVFIRGLDRFARHDPGWRVDGLLTAQVALTSPKYEHSHARHMFAERLEQRLAALPGVRQAGLSSMLPLWGFGSRDFGVEGQPAPLPGQQPLTYYETVSPGFFSALGIRLREGRGFNRDDTTNHPAVVVINESMARHFWPGDSALGKRIGSDDPADPRWEEIVGVVNDIGFPANLDGVDTRFQAYRPIAQTSHRWLAIELRIDGSTEPVTAAIRQIVTEMDPELPVAEIDLARVRLDRHLANTALLGWLLGGFAALGLVLAAIGIYGVIAYSVAQRTAEFGIRLALGASKGAVLWLILKQGLRLSAVGALLGLGGSYAVTHLLAAAAPEIPSRDPVAIAAVTFVSMAVAAFACWFPARRATQVDPMEALRTE